MKNQTSQYGGYLIFAVLVIYHLIERNILYMNTTNNRNDFYKKQLDKTLNGNEKIEKNKKTGWQRDNLVV